MNRTLLVVLAAVLTAAGAPAQERVRPEPASASAPKAVSTEPLVHEIELNAPVEKVWDVFATPEGWKLWGVAKVEVDFRVGGTVKTHYSPQGVIGDEGTIHNQIIAFEPMRMVAFRIAQPPKGFPFPNSWQSTWTVATMTDLGAGRTKLRLAGCGYTADEESQRMRAFFEQGNAWSLNKMKQNLEKSLGAEGHEPQGPAASTRAPTGALDPIVVETTVRAIPADVWECWTTSRGMRSFLAEAKIDLRIGGPFEVYFGGPDVPPGQRGSEGCTILSYEPGRMISFSWNAPPQLAHARAQRTWVVVSIDPHGPHASKVTLKHYGFAEKAAEFPGHAQEWKDTRAYFMNAWPRVLEKLKHRFEPTDKVMNGG